MGKNSKIFVLYLSMLAMIGMMYPKYCFADDTYRIIIEESDGIRKEIPCQEKDIYDIFRADKSQIVVKSKLLEYVEEYLRLCH